MDINPPGWRENPITTVQPNPRDLMEVVLLLQIHMQRSLQIRDAIGGAGDHGG